MGVEEYLGERLGYLLSRAKLLGWAIVTLGLLWEVFIKIPELHHAIEWWLDAAESLGGHMSQVTAAITSQWFGIGVVVFGVGWLFFIGEPRRTVRHPVAPILGWTIFGIAALTFWSVLVAGYTAVHLPKQIEQVALKPIRISQEEKMTMAEELKTAGSFPLGIIRLTDSDSSYVADLLWILKKADWKPGGSVVQVWDEPMIGLYIFVPDSDKIPAEGTLFVPGSGLIPEGAEVLASVLDKHHIGFNIQTSEGQAPGTFSLLIGSRP